MRIYVPGPVPLTPREQAARALRFGGRCIAMLGAGAGAIVVGMAFGSALGIWAEQAVTIALGGP